MTGETNQSHYDSYTTLPPKLCLKRHRSSLITQLSPEEPWMRVFYGTLEGEVLEYFICLDERLADALAGGDVSQQFESMQSNSFSQKGNENVFSVLSATNSCLDKPLMTVSQSISSLEWESLRPFWRRNEELAELRQRLSDMERKLVDVKAELSQVNQKKTRYIMKKKLNACLGLFTAMGRGLSEFLSDAEGEFVIVDVLKGT
ncbi:hypothetical protein BT69DRAFT_1291896 [Atractiella rhizophila]|nr:hypothetical protein BT69DRAFT_1291896 [Atractiella rhizophila]